MRLESTSNLAQLRARTVQGATTNQMKQWTPRRAPRVRPANSGTQPPVVPLALAALARRGTLGHPAMRFRPAARPVRLGSTRQWSSRRLATSVRWTAIAEARPPSTPQWIMSLHYFFQLDGIIFDQVLALEQVAAPSPRRRSRTLPVGLPQHLVAYAWD